MPARKTGNAKNNSEEKKKGRGRFLLVVVLAVLLGGGLTFGVLRFTGVLGKGAEAQAKQAKHATEVLDLGSKVINLTGDGGTGHYLRVQVVLEYKKDKKLAEEIKARQPQITEAVLTILRSKKVEEVLPVQNQEALKKQILEQINKIVGEGKVEQVYFTDFLVQ